MEKSRYKYIWPQRLSSVLAFIGVVQAGWCMSDLTTRPVYVGVALVVTSAAIRGVISLLEKRDAKREAQRTL